MSAACALLELRYIAPSVGGSLFASCREHRLTWLTVSEIIEEPGDALAHYSGPSRATNMSDRRIMGLGDFAQPRG